MFRPRKKHSPAVVSAAYASSDHQRLVTLVNSLSDAVLAINSAGKVQLNNSAALEMFDKNSLTGKNLADFMHLFDEHGKRFPTKELLAGYASHELSHKYNDGSSINLEINVSPVRPSYGSKGGGFVILARDVTEERSLEEERDEFISVASHELRTPIAIAEGNVGNALLLASKNSLSDTIVDSLTSAHEQIIFLSYLINDLSMLSRAESKNPTVNVKSINAQQLASSVVDNYQKKAGDKKLSLTFAVGPDEFSFEANELYVKEILQNFITNSIKYTDRGSVELVAKLNNDEVIFSVKDTGYGISTSEQKKLFSKFFRSQDERVQKHNGTGLGLYVCAKLAKIMGAKILVNSALDKGSVFSLVMPAKQK